MLRPLIQAAAALQQVQLVDSTLESTRVFWRARVGATEAEQLDPRPFLAVIAARAQPTTVKESTE